MLLRNYDKICALSDISHLNSVKLFNEYNVISSIFPRDTSGTSRQPYSDSSAMRRPMTTFSNNGNTLTGGTTFYNCNLIVGTSSTPVTYDDYTMSPISASDIQNVAHSYELTTDESTGELISTYKKTFTALTDTTIKEIGVIQGFQTGSNGYWAVLVYREVLETPINVVAGANAMITLTKRISPNSNQPTDYVATASVE